MEERNLNAPGECDYDYKYDTLFFKLKDREYSRSIEMGNLVLDLDLENFLTGVQIFEASQFLGLDKMKLREISKWDFKSTIKDNIIEIRVNFQIAARNRIIEKNPIIIRESNQDLPDSQLVVCN
jgi:hypothetical protein